jgi:hypothetical protein
MEHQSCYVSFREKKFTRSKTRRERHRTSRASPFLVIIAFIFPCSLYFLLSLPISKGESPLLARAEANSFSYHLRFVPIFPPILFPCQVRGASLSTSQTFAFSISRETLPRDNRDRSIDRSDDVSSCFRLVNAPLIIPNS